MKKVSILLTVCILLGTLSLCVSADDSISTENPGSLDVIQPEPVYSLYTTAWGETYMVDSEGRIAGEIIVNLDVLIDIEPYNNGTTNDFFGVKISKIEKTFEDAWVNGIIERIGYVFSYCVTLDDAVEMNNALDILNENESVLCAVQNTIFECEYDEAEMPYSNAEYIESIVAKNNTRTASTYDEYTALTPHYDLIGVSTAWERGFVGSNNVTVSVIDTGVAEHSEYDNNINFALGKNFANTDALNDVTPDAGDSHGHGVTGIIGADYGDGGVNGICQNINIVPIKFQGGIPELQSSLYYSIVIAEADIINISYSIAEFEPYEDLITNADVLVVVAAGNGGKDITQHQKHAGSVNDAANWIVVGCSTIDDTRLEASNYHKRYVDLFAPGDGVPRVPINNNYSDSFGGYTSYATPMVSAAAALIMSHATHLSAVEVANLLRNKNLVDQVDALDGLCVTGGRLAIDKLVGYLYTCDRGAYTKGDVNGDGFVDMFDYNATKNAVLGQITFTAQQNTAADVNNDNAVDMFDHMIIKQFALMQYYFIP